MKLAAIDIGSNAVRLQVSSVLRPNGQVLFKRVEYLRFPLRLGYDTFKYQRISTDSETKLIQLLKAFKILIDLYGVDHHMACATAALREAKNKLAIIQRVQEETGFVIHLLSGEEEASMIYKAIKPLLTTQHNYLHIDVGGGSTEISFYEGKKQIVSRSFSLGSVRVQEGYDLPETWKAMQLWITQQRKHFPAAVTGIATGGNIRKLAQLTKKDTKKSILLSHLAMARNHIASLNMEERINKLQLNPDRAAVILSATQIYETAMRCGSVEEIIVPNVSLRDGIIQAIYEQNLQNKYVEI